jgi:hypothetical protein
MAALTTLFFHSVLMPPVPITNSDAYEIQPGRNRPLCRSLSIRHAPLASGNGWSTLGTALWGVVLCLGAWNLVTMREKRGMRTVLAITVAGQVLLHLVYGPETFLYVLHFLPLLIVIAAFSTLTKYRRIALVLTTALVMVAGYHNVRSLQKADQLAQSVRRSAPQVESCP